MSENNNNNNYQNRVSTSGITLFDKNGMMLRLAYLDDSLSIVFGEPQVSENGKRKYPNELRSSTIITSERAVALYEEVILKKVLPALEQGNDYNGGVITNQRGSAILEIRVQQGDVYIVYHKDINENRNPGKSYVFQCQKVPLIEGYSPEEGSFEKAVYDGVFMLFCKYLESGIYDLLGASTHSFRYYNRFTTNSIFDYLKGVAAKLGVTPEGRQSYNPRQNTQSGFMNIEGDQDEVPFNELPMESGNLSDIL